MFQAGEVDYLVATDAIGMGLNMDVAPCRLRLPRQVRRRAPAPADRRRNGADRRARRAPPARRHVRHARRRRGRARFTARRGLRDRGAPLPAARPSLLARGRARLRRARRADRRSGGAARRIRALRAAPRRSTSRCSSGWPRSPGIARPRRAAPALVARLWEACGLPDFRKLGAEPHARFVARLFRHLSEGDGHIRADWFAERGRAARQRRGRCRDDRRAASRRSAAGPISRSAPTGWPIRARWAERARALEERLSDALHAAADPALRRPAHQRADAPIGNGRRRAARRDRSRRAR